MRRLLAWVAGALGGLAAYRLFRRRRGGVIEAPAAPAPEAEAGPDPRAEELRAKLAEAGPAVAEEPSPQPGADEDPEQRRRRVHEAGRAAVDEMHEAE